MPREKGDLGRRLQWAALELFRDRGYEQTTATEIAARVGVTERTFFRYFPDKREVLFDGDAAFTEALSHAVRNGPPALGSWDTLFRAFRSVEHLLTENRSFTDPRRRIIAITPALQERELAKTRSLIAALASALRERGVASREADLAAQIGINTLGYAFTAWLDDNTSDLGDQLVRAFHEVRDLASSYSEQR